MRNSIFAIAAFFVFLCSAPLGLHAQVVTGSVVGVVRDASGAVVGGATITATNDQTGLRRVVKSNDTGNYLISSLPVGSYTLVAEGQGFSTQTIKNIVLEVTQEARIDIQLSVSVVQESVTVAGAAPLLNTENASLGDVVNTRRVEELPLNVRNFMAFTTLSAGTNEAQPGEFRKGYTGKSFAPSVAGLFPEMNEYRLDGIENREDYFNSYSIAPPVDSIQEFKIQVGQYSAESGGGGAAIINVLTKSGTNEFHGSLYEFLRNDKLDARNYFAAQKPPYRQNQFGASLGGPVVKNHAFFFGNYEGRRILKGLTATARVPTAAEASGNLTSLGKSIIDPLSGAPFPGATIPTSRLDPITQKVLQFYPTPNLATTGSVPNFLSNPRQITNQDSAVARYDQIIGQRDTVFARYAYQTGPLGSPGTFPKVGTLTTENDVHHGVMGETRTFGNMVNELRFGVNRNSLQRLPQNQGNPLTQQIGLTYASPTEQAAQGFIESVGVSTSAISGISESRSSLYALTNIEFADTFSWSFGRHNIKVGGNLIRTNAEVHDSTHATGAYTFSGTFTGDGFADMLLGDPSAMTLSLTPLRNAYTNRWNIYGFVTDDWKVTPNLTLNIGARYELQTAIKEDNGELAAFDPNLNNGQGGLLYSKDAKLGDFFTSVRPDLPHGTLPDNANFLSDANNLAPRFGFAYRPLGSSKTVIRGGYGWFYGQQSAFNVITNGFTSPPFTEWPVFSSDPKVPQLGWNKLNVTNPTDPLKSLAFGLFVSLAPDGKRQTFLNPYTQQWSFSVGHSLTNSLAVRAEYLGSKTTHLVDEINDNLAPPSPLAVQPRRKYPSYGRILSWQTYGDSNYNALLLTAEQRFAKGLVFTGSYSYSKSLGDTVDLQQDFHPDPTNLRQDKGPNDFDVRQVFTLNYLYELPVGPGKTFAGDSKGFTAKILGGWQLGGIITLHTGFPSTPTIPSSFLNAGESIVPRADVLKPNYGNLPDSQRSISMWFDPAAFSIPRYRYGTAQRNTLRQPGVENWDIAIQKNTDFREGQRLEFRWEMFNTFNHANFGFATTDVSSPNFGKIFSASDPRDMQVSLRYRF